MMMKISWSSSQIPGAGRYDRYTCHGIERTGKEEKVSG